VTLYHGRGRRSSGGEGRARADTEVRGRHGGLPVQRGVASGISTSALVALEAATGAERWRLELAADDLSTPAVVGGLIFVGSRAGSVYAIGGAGATRAVDDGKRGAEHR